MRKICAKLVPKNLSDEQKNNRVLVSRELLDHVKSEYSGSKIYNHLTLNIKMLSEDAKQFKSKLRRYLVEHTFYSLDEYYQLIF